MKSDLVALPLYRHHPLLARPLHHHHHRVRRHHLLHCYHRKKWRALSNTHPSHRPFHRHRPCNHQRLRLQGSSSV